MLTRDGLTSLQNSLRNTRVLTAYLAAKDPDRSHRNAWRPALTAALKECERAVQRESHDERLEFNAARRALLDVLDDAVRIDCDGIACFVTARGVQRVEALAYAVEPAVTWGLGIPTAPLIRALKEERPVILAVMHGMTARLHRYQFEQLTVLESFDLPPHHTAAEPARLRASRRFHRGVRGATARDTAQHEWAAATDRLVRTVVQRLTHHAADDAWVLVGGRRDVVHRVLALLPAAVRRRADLARGIQMRSAKHVLLRAARDGASRLRNASDLAALHSLSEHAGTRGSAALGPTAARGALNQACVQQLYLSQHFVKEHAADAESAVRAALDQGATIETVSGEASQQLDAMGGIAARMRYETRPMTATGAGLSLT